MIRKKLSYLAILTSLLLSSGVFAQQCDEAQPSTTPNSRYQLLNSGQEVKDLKTGLIWQRCLVGEQWNGRACIGEIQNFSHPSSLTYIRQHAPNWRIPSINELLTLGGGCWQHAININIFPVNPERIERYDSYDTLRSSTKFIPNAHEAQTLRELKYDKLDWYWAFETGHGQKSYLSYDLPMRLVRK
ncbi:Lcl C-terminal domain-containing protein [Acinetobacter bereziniae]|uniref:Lcl C-terminal domain-containing protein n=1 Tax=Acinetobacter bereziniae TaxID=106648 RepID=UPI001901D8CB|nr:DUF1566 domain-containing protein [Acinetobacter bereziniae]MBJ9907166.1 DUF1566 domain-containing protein [Acinetobacter bereziniae]MBJ9931033.1 DUF1566 domain-containing protein [Acinetobacter bereziniae]